MTETTITTATEDGEADARLIVPEGEGPWPLVVYYADAGGLRPTTSRMGERLASAGYAVLQPNPFWRAGPFEPFDTRTVFSDPSERARLMALLATVRPANVIADTKALVSSLAADRRIDAARIGMVGYCMGGRLAFIASTVWPERVAAVASIHGGGLVTDAEDSPHRGAGRIRASLYLGVADEDPSCTPEHQRALREALDAAGVDYQLELYPGARHGFAMPDFPVYDEAASEKHWERVLALFGRALR
jgi:carboxymethylenebutenolidase